MPKEMVNFVKFAKKNDPLDQVKNTHIPFGEPPFQSTWKHFPNRSV